MTINCTGYSQFIHKYLQYSISTVYTVITPYLNKRLKNDNVIKPVIYVLAIEMSRVFVLQFTTKQDFCNSG